MSLALYLPHIRSSEMSGLSDRRNGHLQPGDSRGQFGALTSRRVGREPSEPLLVHAHEVVLVGQDNGGADYLVQRTTCRLENGLYVDEALAGLLLNGSAIDSARGWIHWPCARDEHQ